MLRLATGVACGALIGVERRWRARMAGLRTNALVSTGATLFVLHLVLRPAGHLLDRTPAAGTDSDAGVRATVHLRCERPTESHIRAQLLQALTICGLEDDPPPMEHQAAA
ncbi:MgtC/SapB family protein [Streptomyces scopuliridis]|uniref:MgtC/SapB family protein n=1 Tax=Streptomyces scopuliridis TaxID=452529 RepID=A0ACD4ZF15_9ACTN|nr:MgtC/SapB family protein [Streptomyces scopuliridis]WSB32154.1 MgtC/SapB family protein [Streptomyces scopuliridis]WSB96411.1 MgtC/SapB family protein [Streptomyces scopuliridis]WSC09884.1 MgtC/SapB family protein [Streptomyces scopuliridis]